ncbi:MAG: YheU family protein [Myxococcota bacterium]|nr:YheU family protein [Myxococcota bacterium]
MDESPPYVEVPLEEVEPETLRALVEAFVGREGTDYGRVEKTLEEKVADVLRQLERSEAHLVFDAESESVNIVSAAELAEARRREGATP